MTIKKTPVIAEETTEIQSTDNDQSIVQEQLDKKEQIKNVLEEKDIAQTLEFLLGDNPGESKGIIEEMYNKLYLAINKSKNECLSGTMIIKSDFVDKNTKMTDYAGIEKAFNLIIQNSERKIIVMDTIVDNLDDYKNYDLIIPVYEQYKDKIHMMKQAKNLRFFHYSTCDFINAMRLRKLFKEDTEEVMLSDKKIRETLQPEDEEEQIKNIEDMVELWGFDTLKTAEQMSFETKRIDLAKVILGYKEPETIEVNITAWESDEAFQGVIENEIVHFLHNRSNREHMLDEKSLGYEEDLPKLFNLAEDRKSKNRLEFEDKLITLLHLQHTSFKLLPRKNNLQWIVDTFKYMNTQLLHEGERFEGVFVDRDGTLYDNKNQQFNQNIIDMIEEYNQQGKKIIIWSGGNLEMKQELLDNEPQLSHHKIQSKTEYKGGTVEISIDNDSAELLYANAKIKTEQHINV